MRRNPSRRSSSIAAGARSAAAEPTRFPGSVGIFDLFGEVMLTGVLVTVVGLGVVTLPGALAAGIRHLNRYALGNDSRLRLFWHDARLACTSGALLGLGSAALAIVLVADVTLASTASLPGAGMIAVVGWAGIALLCVWLLRAAAVWTPTRGWRAALLAVPRLIARDLRGTLTLVATSGFVVLLTWVLTPLLAPAMGCAVLAAFAVSAGSAAGHTGSEAGYDRGSGRVTSVPPQ